MGYTNFIIFFNYKSHQIYQSLLKIRFLAKPNRNIIDLAPALQGLNLNFNLNHSQ